MNQELDSATVQSITYRVSTIERQISTLTSELEDIKRILNAKTLSESSLAHKRKFTEFSDSNGDDGDHSKKVKCNFNYDSNGYVQVYTDGACENNGKAGAKAGIGVWFGHGHPLNLAEPVKRRPTNNVGEIEACTRAIQVAHSAGVRKLCINTDSEFTINCITKWIRGWKKNGFKTAKGAPVLNKDELTELDQTINLMEDVKWNHVRGHRGIEGNEAADALARTGAAQYKSKKY
ncbi:ribonuclease H1 [Carabus blaptoides fortunei]